MAAELEEGACIRPAAHAHSCPPIAPRQQLVPRIPSTASPIHSLSLESHSHRWGEPPSYDPAPTVAFLRVVIDELVSAHGGDRQRVTLAGSSRGAIAAWHVGLYDDTVAALWRSFLVYAHCDGEYIGPYPDGPINVTQRLARLRGRPSFVCNCDVADEKAKVLALCPESGGACDGLEWSDTPFRNHNDQWVLRPSAERAALREWWARTLASL